MSSAKVPTPSSIASRTRASVSGRPVLLYLHGFLSSPESLKCRLLQDWVTGHAPDVEFVAPLLSPHPLEVAEQLDTLVAERLQSDDRPVGLVGSSMGGFWSTWLAERYQLPAVLVNPAVQPARFMPAYVGQTLTPYSGEMREYRLGQADVDGMSALQAEVQAPLRGRYWLLGQRGDETLDCREAETFYAGQRQTVEEGGDHGFQGFDRFCQPIIEFLFAERGRH